MKKNKIIQIFISAVLLLAISSCEKFLNVKPKGKDILQNIDHYNGLLNNMNNLSLINYRIAETGGTTILGTGNAPLIMSDDVFTTPQYFGTRPSSEIKAYKWNDLIYEEYEDPSEWGALYVPIYVYNLVINGVMDCTGATVQRKKEVLAEARINRAFNYLFLVNLYAKPYNSATMAQDPGVPLVTKADITAKNFPRASVKDIYDFIVKEIEESIPDLPVQTKVRVRLGLSAAWFILGRTYFYMKDYSKAITALNNSETSAATLPFTVAIYDYNTLMNSTPPTGWYNPALPHKGSSGHPLMFDCFEVIYLKQVSIVLSYFNNNIFVKDAVINKYGSSDLRKRMFSNKDYMTGVTTLPGYQRCSPSGVNWGPSFPDLYLMRAECKARTNDLIGAKTDLETLRKKRMPANDAVVPVTTKDAMIKFVLDERIREFAGTGLRWFDMRRLSQDTEYNNIDYTRTYGADIYTLQNKRLTMKIPSKILLFNPNMSDNE